MSALSLKIKLCPTAGTGVNRWTFTTACILFRAGWNEDEVRDYLNEHTTRLGQQADAEIERAIERAPQWIRQGAASSRKKWPAIDRVELKKALSSGIGVEELRGFSPVKQAFAHQVLPILFPDNPLIWAARSVHPEIGDTLPLQQWLPVAGMQQFIVPNPMISRVIPNNGKSKRCLTNTGPRVYLVIESDNGTPDEQAAILWHLSRFARLVMAVHSASKSVHGWFHVAERSEKENRAFMEYAVSLGADPATWVKCQPVRMPAGHRPNKGKQEILFFNAAAIGGAQ
jgi:hypothetical protein